MFDKNVYKDILSHPDWYLLLHDFLTEHFYEFRTTRIGKDRDWYLESEAFEALVLESLKDGSIALGEMRIGIDKKRKPIDTIIIHHSSRDPKEDFERSGEALSLIRLYAKEFSNKANRYYGKPITSDHFYDGRMTFLPYHYVIWPDGKVVNYLKDEYLAWHAGYLINPSSIAICFHSDLENAIPSMQAIQSARTIIEQYKNVQILGHREVSATTTCPGNLFLGEKGWKRLLL
jgi:N-acetylmuramoyl-L-alanine amidase